MSNFFLLHCEAKCFIILTLPVNAKIEIVKLELCKTYIVINLTILVHDFWNKALFYCIHTCVNLKSNWMSNSILKNSRKLYQKQMSSAEFGWVRRWNFLTFSIMPFILWDKTPPAAYAERVEVFIYNRVVEIYTKKYIFFSFAFWCFSGISLGALGRGKAWQ